jgi:glucans biosynthesis protein
MRPPRWIRLLHTAPQNGLLRMQHGARRAKGGISIAERIPVQVGNFANAQSRGHRVRGRNRTMKSRVLLHVFAMASVVFAFAMPDAHAFSFKDVDARAQQRASAGFKPPEPVAPAAFRDLDETHYHAIHFQPKATYWQSAKTNFTLQFFHPGWRFIDPVKLNEITTKGVKEIAFSPSMFDYDGSGVTGDSAKGASFAGFRIHYPVNSSDKKDEVLSFLGASYFRALGKDQAYGLSARGLAIDTALSSGEEFPRFVEFWIQRPKPKATSLTIYGLLDSPRATGAYEFTLKPGLDTTVHVRARLHMRDNVAKLGLAPLTSMFFFGSNQHATHDDYRPEIHDSDGLSIHGSNGEWVWRPLVNPKHLLVTSFAQTDPSGYGLMQRTRAFNRYEDIVTPYQAHPSAWVEPDGKWGEGRIELVEIPSPDETNDNISAFWLSKEAVTDIAYTLHWQKNIETHPASAWVMQTLSGQGFPVKQDGAMGFVIDFTGPMFADGAASGPVEAQVSGDANVSIVEQKAVANPEVDGWRVLLRVKPKDDKKSAELRVSLRRGEQSSETWSYVIPPE